MVELKVCFILLLLLLWPSVTQAEVYEWTDSKGVIHFTDDFLSVPDAFRNSRNLTVRREAIEKRRSVEASVAKEVSENAPPQDSLPREDPGPREHEVSELSSPVIYYNPENVAIVVVNSVAPQKKHCLLRHRCEPAFRPNFNDRRFIHPSAFNRASHLSIRPKKAFRSARR